VARREPTRYWAIRNELNLYIIDKCPLPLGKIMDMIPEARNNPTVLASITPQPVDTTPEDRFSRRFELIDLGRSQKSKKEGHARLNRQILDERNRLRLLNTGDDLPTVKLKAIEHALSEQIFTLHAKIKADSECQHLISHYGSTGFAFQAAMLVEKRTAVRYVLALLKDTDVEAIHETLCENLTRPSESYIPGDYNEGRRLQRYFQREAEKSVVVDLREILATLKQRRAALEVEDKIRQLTDERVP